MNPIQVLVVDDHVVFREGLRALLGRDPRLEIVAEASTTEEAIEATATSNPDVVLMDLDLPGAGGEAATAAILATRADTAVLILTMHSDDAHLRDAIAAGARGYLLKDAEPEAIIRSIIAVHQGQVIFDRGVAAQVLAGSYAAKHDRPFPALTDRECDILDRMARGVQNEAIATRMGISIKTVQNNVSSILLKLGARDRAQAVAMARDVGLGHGGTP